MLDDSTTPTGLSADLREGMTVHTSATAGPARTLEQATTAALTSLVRTADERDLEVDVTTLTTRVRPMRMPFGEPGAIVHLVLATATAYPA